MNDAERLRSAKQHYDAAVAAHRRNQWTEAERHYLAVRKIYPTHPGALHGLGLIAMRESRHTDAAEYLQRASDAASANLAIRYDLGAAYLHLGRYERALDCFKTVLATQPGNVQALARAGDALGILGRTAEARDVFETLLDIDPKNAVGHFGLGNVMAQLGKTAEARSAFELAVTLAPRQAAYHRALAETSRFVEGDSRLSGLEALAYEAQSLADDQKVELHFALAKAYDDLERTDDAFVHLHKGNTLRRRLIAYDESQIKEFFSELATLFTPETLPRKMGDPSTIPIFIVGMPRSGTTLVEQILTRDPGVLGAGELTAVQNLIAEGHAGKDYPCAPLSDETLAGFGRNYVKMLGALPQNIGHVIDKFPGNFQHIGLVHLALPNARIIHIRRDATDTCFSCYSKLFLNGLNYAYDLGELGRYYRMYESLMAHWRSVLPKGVMLEVQYETLVGDFDSETRRIVEYCGLAWNERFLSFHKNERAVRTHSQSQVRRPLFTSSVGRWRRYEAHLKPLLDALGQPG